MTRQLSHRLDAHLPRVLVVANDHHMGNTILTLPIIEELAQYFTKGIDLLIDHRYIELPAMLASSERIRVLPYQGKASSGSRASQHLRIVRKFGRLVGHRYSAVIDTVGSMRSTTVTAASLSRRRIGLSSGRRAWIYSDVIQAQFDTHYGIRYAQLLKTIGNDTEARPARLSADAPGHSDVEGILEQQFPGCENPIVVIHPMAGHPLRCWPVERFAAVADGLVERLAAKVVVIGGPGDRAIAQELIDAMRSGDCACFQVFTLPQLVALFEKASVLVSNESGPTHLAAATDLPIVTIFGPTKERLWRPMRDLGLTVLRGDTCDPKCRKRGCVAESRCLLNLQVQTVLDHAIAGARVGCVHIGGPGSR